jgi:hypothetical protein
VLVGVAGQAGVHLICARICYPTSRRESPKAGSAQASRRHDELTNNNNRRPTTPLLCVSTLNDMVRNVQATTATGLRKNRVTQKTRLRVVRGQLDVEEAIVLDDEEERNRVLASQGVDAEDANVSSRCMLTRRGAS